MPTKMNSYTEGRVKQNISPKNQRTEFGLRAVKTYGNAENDVGCKEDFWEATDGDVEGCNQDGTSARNRQTPV